MKNNFGINQQHLELVEVQSFTSLIINGSPKPKHAQTVLYTVPRRPRGLETENPFLMNITKYQQVYREVGTMPDLHIYDHVIPRKQ